MKAAWFISFAFHPILMPLMGIVLMFQAGHWLFYLPIEAQRYIYLVVVVSTILLPLATMPLLKRKGFIQSYYLEDARERRIPLLMASFFYMAGAFILHKVQAPVMIPLFLNGSAMVILICAVFTFKWKISNHLAALGGVTGMVLAISIRWMTDARWILVLLFILAGLVGFSRLKLNAHKPLDIYMGYLMGFMINFLLIRYF